MKSWSLNLLEPSGPHRACYGTVLPFTADGLIRRISGMKLAEKPEALEK